MMKAEDAAATKASGSVKRVGRPTLENAKLIRERILEGATSVFLKHGFRGASMDEIAASSEVSKQAVYAYFTSKNLLFEALIDRIGTALFEPQILPLKHGEAPGEALRRFGLEIMSHVSQRTFTLVAGESRTLPASVAKFWEKGPTQFRQRLRTYLEEQVRLGLLEISDLNFATEQMIALFTGPLISRLVMGRPSFFEDEVDLNRWVDEAVAIFLLRYAKKRRRRSPLRRESSKSRPSKSPKH